MSQRTGPGFRTEIEFTLPKGYLDEHGVLHRQGTMRLATAADEILPLRDPRVQQNAAYLTIIVMARVIERLGSLPEVDTKIVEGLYASDLDYLQRLYEQINALEESDTAAAISAAANGQSPLLRAGSAQMGGSLMAYPHRLLYEEMAFIAFHFHWSRDELMGLDHAERRRWCREISVANRRLDGASDTPST